MLPAESSMNASVSSDITTSVIEFVGISGHPGSRSRVSMARNSSFMLLVAGELCRVELKNLQILWYNGHDDKDVSAYISRHDRWNMET